MFQRIGGPHQILTNGYILKYSWHFLRGNGVFLESKLINSEVRFGKNKVPSILVPESKVTLKNNHFISFSLFEGSL